MAMGNYWDQFQDAGAAANQQAGLPTNPDGITRTMSGGPYMPGEPQYKSGNPVASYQGSGSGLSIAPPAVSTGPVDQYGQNMPSSPTGLPGNSQLPGYGDWNTSNPWRDSLTYEQIRDYGRNNPNAGTTTPTAGAPTTGAQGGSGDPEAFRAAWFASPYPKTTDGLKQFVAANPQFGATITGSKGSKVLIGGQAFQAVRSAGLNGGIGPAWDSLGPEGGGGAGGGSLGSLGGGFGSYVTPWDKPFQARDPNQIANDPAYQFQLGEGKRAVQSSAASRGTLLTGGTLKALDRFGQGLASTYNDKYYGRDMGEYLLGRENFYNNQDRPFNKNLSLATLGKPS